MTTEPFVLYPDHLWRAFRCPDCRAGRLKPASTGAVCDCGAVFGRTAAGALDLRPKEAHRYTLEHVVGNVPLPEGHLKFPPLAMNPAPAVDFSGQPVPPHMTRELLSYLPRARRPESLMLDLGCGTGSLRRVGEQAGFTYVGMDYANAGAPLLADGHLLPFADEAFEFILSVAVLEHIRNPFVMMREACRVLEPGGLFLGTVAFLEPFHGRSFYHHTHLGTCNSLLEGGFELIFVAPSLTWHALLAQVSMGLLPWIPLTIARALVLPMQVLHRTWWWGGALLRGRDMEPERQVATTAAFMFLARRPA